MKDLINKLLKSSLAKFVLVGGCSTLIDFVIYMLLSMKLPITLSKAISMICASVFSYFVNKLFTFENKDKTNAKYLIKFYIVFALNFGANLAVNYLVFSATNIKIIAFIFATLAGMTVNYLGQRFFVFKKNKI